MPDALSDAQWAGIRAICEGEPPTHGRVAQATGVYVKTISRRAAKEGWKTLDFRFKRVRTAWRQTIELAAMARDGEELDPAREEEDFSPEEGEEAAETALEPWPDESPAERIVRIGAVLNKRVEIMLRRLEAGHPLESRQVSALSNLVDLSERIAVMARQEIEERKNQDDDELRATLKRIDERIVYLAECRALYLLVTKFGIPEEEVKAKVPEPVEGESWKGDEIVELDGYEVKEPILKRWPV